MINAWEDFLHAMCDLTAAVWSLQALRSVVCFSCRSEESDPVQLLAELHWQIGFVLWYTGYF